MYNILRLCLTCRRQTPPPPASAPWPPPAAAGWQQATPSWPRPPSCPPPPSPPPPKWTKQGMLEAWQTHLTLHEKLSLLGELLPEDSPSTKAAFSLQLKMKMHFFIFFHPQYLHSRIQLCHNCYQKKNESQGQLQSTRNISFRLIYVVVSPTSSTLDLSLSSSSFLSRRCRSWSRCLRPTACYNIAVTESISQHAPHWIFSEMSPSCSPKSCC